MDNSFQYPMKRRIEAARLVVDIITSLRNLTGTSTARLPRCLPKFRAIVQFWIPIWWLRDFERSYNKMFIGYWNTVQAIACWLCLSTNNENTFQNKCKTWAILPRTQYFTEKFLVGINKGDDHTPHIVTENKVSSIWQLCSHWWHRNVLLRQLTVPPLVPLYNTRLTDW